MCFERMGSGHRARVGIGGSEGDVIMLGIILFHPVDIRAPARIFADDGFVESQMVEIFLSVGSRASANRPGRRRRTP